MLMELFADFHRASSSGWHTRDLDRFNAEIEARGWSAVARDIAESWTGKFVFQAEQVDLEGRTIPGKQGLQSTAY